MDWTLTPEFWALMDHLWWFLLGGLSILVLLVALVYGPWDDDDPPAPRGET